MYPANAENFKIGKGGLLAALWTGSTTPPDADALGNPIGNCENVTLEFGDPQVLEKFSSTQNNSPLADRRNLRQTVSVLCQCDEHTFQNLTLYMMGGLTETAQGALSAQTKTLTAVEQGKYYAVGKYGITITAVAADGTVAAVVTDDYVYYPANGTLYIVPGGAILDGVDVEVTFDQAARTVNKIIGASDLNKFVKLTFLSDDANTDGTTAKGVLTVWKAQVAPEGGYTFVSDEYGQYQLRFTMLLDSENHADELFKIEYPEA